MVGTGQGWVRGRFREPGQGGSRRENQSQYKKPPCLDDTGTYCAVREGIEAQPKRVDEMAKEYENIERRRRRSVQASRAVGK